MEIQWYPGHMTKTRRKMETDLKLVDAVCEILDARIPISSRNPDMNEICGTKPRMVVLNRSDLADPTMTAKWIAWYKARGIQAIATEAKSRKGVSPFSAAVRSLLSEKVERYAAKGQAGRSLKIMIVGIPNVGKSTFINQLAGRQSAKAENRPGVTRGMQWISLESGLLLMDTPGILWPKFESREVGQMLAYTGAVKDTVLDLEELACNLLRLLWQEYPDAVRARYGIEMPDDAPGWELLEACARKRGFLVSGGEINTERMAQALLEEFRSGKLGRFTIERPEDVQ
ncbi:MAG: ribosome biogenesis GTPase YlqF [Oscillospiraceae bacterium]|nr:ribosome biogenesis GTPase YlqF [Oscillospiraceae bacterium]